MTSASDRASCKHFLLCLIAASLLLAAFAPKANAAFTSPFASKCSGLSILGYGTQVQESLHDRVFDYWRGHTSSTKTRGCGTRARQRVSYAPLSMPADGVGIEDTAFGAWLAGRFVGLDRAPTISERAAAEGTASRFGPAKLYVTPIAQTAATMIVNFPKHCELRAGDPNLASYARFKISNAQLVGAWVGDPSLDTWGELLPGIRALPGNSSGKTDQACRDQAIKRVVPREDTPHARYWKRLLAVIAPWRDWLHHMQYGTWPNLGGVVHAASREHSEVAKETARTNGSIGFVDLKTARSGGFQKKHESSSPSGSLYRYEDSNRQHGQPTYGRVYTFKESRFWIPLETQTPTQVTGSGNFAEPTVDFASIRTARKGANCRDAKYTNVPHTPGGRVDHYGDWTSVIADYPTGVYPGCVFTYIGVWDDAADVYGGGLFEQGRTRTVKDYVTFASYYGQNVLYQSDYAPVPYSTTKQHDLRWAPRRAATLMGWNKP